MALTIIRRTQSPQNLRRVVTRPESVEETVPATIAAATVKLYDIYQAIISVISATCSHAQDYRRSVG